MLTKYGTGFSWSETGQYLYSICTISVDDPKQVRIKGFLCSNLLAKVICLVPDEPQVLELPCPHEPLSVRIYT